MDPDCVALREDLEPAAGMLDPFELQNMRVRWRRWVIFYCNWKVAAEAFNEIYHVDVTHPEFMQFGEFRGWAKAQGLHSNIGYDRSEEHTSELQSLMRISYAVFCLKKKKKTNTQTNDKHTS